VLLAALSDGQKAGIAGMGAAFMIFALVSSFVIPRRMPNFPGKRGVWPYVGVVVTFFVAMMAVIVFVGKEKSEAKAAAPSPPPATSPQPPAPPGPKGNPAAGKAVFAANGCAACHTFKPANAGGKIGPDLGNLAADAKTANRGSLAQYTTESIVDPNAYVVPKCPSGPCVKGTMPSTFGKTLSKQQLADLVAFLTAGS
jgi:mono/diheme cytochrome c family protein